MRLSIILAFQKSSLVPYDHSELLQASIYNFLARSDSDYATQLHDVGYVSDTDAKRHFKLFTFSNLQLNKSQRQPIPQGLLVQPGHAEWFIGSPLVGFLEHYARGLQRAGVLTLGNLQLPIRDARMTTTPDFSRFCDPETGLATVKFTCITPIVASVPSADGRDTAYYLRPDQDAERFSEQVRQNLLKKHALIHGDSSPVNDTVRLVFRFGLYSEGQAT